MQRNLPRIGFVAAPFALLVFAALIPAAPAAEPAAATIPWDLIDCTYAVAFVPAESSRVSALLPPGFEPRPAAGPAGLNALPAGVVNVGVEANACAEGAGLSGRVPDMTYASFWVAVEPPIALRVPGIGAYYVNWDVLVPDADRRDVLRDAGLRARDGDVAMDLDAAAATFAADYDLAGLGDFRMDATIVDDPVFSLNGEFVQWTEGADGDLTRWRVKYAADSVITGVGTVDVPDGSWLADLFGASTVPARFAVGEWDYTDGEIVLPTA